MELVQKIKQYKILRNILKANEKGLLPDSKIRIIFKELISGCLSLEEVLKVAFLGPEGTHSESAVHNQFGSQVIRIPTSTIEDVFFQTLNDEVNMGVVPVENSSEGVINTTLNCLADNEDIKIIGEIYLDIEHQLAAGNKFNIKDTATNPDNLYKLGTRVNKSFIRVESDEVTYPLHIILRFNLERKIFNNEINIADIPDAWNDEFNRLFNLSIDKDTDGCLQDIHWFAGLFGYFPTYSLGALTAAQFASQLRTDQKELDKEIENGEFSNLVNWLKKNIHEKASFFSTNEVLEQVTKSPLNAKYFKEYITNRYL